MYTYFTTTLICIMHRLMSCAYSTYIVLVSSLDQNVRYLVKHYISILIHKLVFMFVRGEMLTIIEHLRAAMNHIRHGLMNCTY